MTAKAAKPSNLTRLIFAPLLLGLSALPAAAQYIPGLETPKSTADGFEQMLATACPLAVIGEDLAGFTKDHPKETAASVVEALPQALAPYVVTSPKMRIMKIANPGDDLFVVLDTEAPLCTVIAMTDPAPIQRQLIDPMTVSDAWPEIEKPGPAFNYGFVYNFAGSIKLAVKFSLPIPKPSRNSDAGRYPIIATVSPMMSVQE